jgi:peroxiredoxin
MRLTPIVVVCGILFSLASSTPGHAQEPKSTRAGLQPAAKRRAAPKVALQDGTGKTVRLSDFRGRVVLVDFWATSCGGCVQEIPMFVDVVNANKARGFEAIGISEDIVYENLENADEAWRKIKPFVRQRKIPYPIVLADSRVTMDFNITAIPATFLIDRKGRIAATYVGVVQRSNLEANVESLLAETK